MDIFTDERSLFRKRINKIMQENPIKEIIEDLIRLHLLRVASKDENQLVMVELYNLLGAELFSEVLEIVNGRKVSFPDAESFKETIEIALCYYYRYFHHRDWEEIKVLLQNDNFSTIKYGINCTKLQQFINELSSLSAIDETAGKNPE